MNGRHWFHDSVAENTTVDVDRVFVKIPSQSLADDADVFGAGFSFLNSPPSLREAFNDFSLLGRAGVFLVYVENGQRAQVLRSGCFSFVIIN